MVAKALVSTRHTVLVHLVATRRCNLSCAYCNEYDQVSKPVPLELLLRRVDDLASRGTSIITISGGEPLLHPELEQVVSDIRRRGIIATVITNGYLLTEQRIKGLNAARLDYLQISIDNVNPDEVSMKSLKVLDSKLVLLSKHAEFGVNVNAVLGSEINNPEDARVVGESGPGAGIPHIIGHHSLRQRPGKAAERASAEHLPGESLEGRGPGSSPGWTGSGRTSSRDAPTAGDAGPGPATCTRTKTAWLHWCSQQRGYPGVPPGGLLQRGDAPAVLHGEALRRLLHRSVRAPGLHDGLAGAIPRSRAKASRGGRTA